MVEAVTNWAAEHPADAPRDLRFTIIDTITVNVFEAELERQFAGAG